MTANRVLFEPAHASGNFRAMRFSFFCYNVVSKQEMEAYCEKYRRRLSGKDICCRHPMEYCKFRFSCMAHLIGMGKTDGEAEKIVPDHPESDRASEQKEEH